MSNIIRLNLDNCNFTNRQKEVGFKIVNTDNILNNAEDYELCIEKADIPIEKNLPLFNWHNDIRITLEAMDKTEKDPIFVGDSVTVSFSLPRQFSSLKEIASEINKIIYSKLSETYRWAYLSTEDDEKITLRVENQNQISKTRIWIDGVFSDLFTGFVENNGRVVQGVESFQLFPPKPTDGSYTQSKGHLEDFFNLKTFRVYSSLPTTPFWLYDQESGTMVKSNLVGEIIFNAKDMIGNKNLLYIPFVFRQTSMLDAGSISKFDLWVHAYYSNTMEQPVTMGKNGYVSVTFAFSRKNKI